MGLTYEAIEALIEKDEREIMKLVELLKEGVTTFANTKGKQEGLLHPCTRSDYNLQFSIFDELGPVGDIQRNSLEEIAKVIHEYGFKPQKDLKIVS